MTEVTEILQAARDLIGKPERWMQNHIAVDRDGFAVYAEDPTAVGWCAVGALWCVSHRQSPFITRAAEKLLRGMAEKLYYRELSDYNDSPGRTHEEIMALYDMAIKSARDEHGHQ